MITGDKAREQKEASERSAEDQRRAGGSYSTANPDDLGGSSEEGLPWGSISLRHIVSTGRSKEKDSRGDSARTAASRDRSSLR